MTITGFFYALHLSDNLPPVVYQVIGGLVRVLNQYTVCYGTSTADCLQRCTATPGVTCILGAVQTTNGILLEPLDGDILRIATTDRTVDPSDPAYSTSIAFVGADGSVTLGPSPQALIPASITVQGTPTNGSTLIGMYVTSTVWSLYDEDDAIRVYSACHINNASLCGNALEFVSSGRVLFYSARHVIDGYVDYGLIAASSSAYYLINGSTASGEDGQFLFTSFNDNGVAAPILRNPLNPPPPSQGLWLDVLNATTSTSCAVYAGPPWTSQVPFQTCFNMSSLPWHVAAAAGQNFAPSYGFVELGDTGVSFTVFSDPGCTASVGTLSSYGQWGCNTQVYLGAGLTVAFYWRMQV